MRLGALLGVNSVDIMPVLVKRIGGISDVSAVYVELPHGEKLPAAPVADLQYSGPPAHRRSAQGPGVDITSVDVDVYMPAAMDKIGQGHRLASEIRKNLIGFTYGRMVVSDVTAPVRRPDRNANIRRWQIVVDVMAPAFYSIDEEE